MTSLTEIEAELSGIRIYARTFERVSRTRLLRSGRVATAADVSALKAQIARFEVLVRAADRLHRYH